VLLGGILDAWTTTWPASRERQREHDALVDRVLGHERREGLEVEGARSLGDLYRPPEIIEPEGGLIPFRLVHKREPEKDDAGRWAVAFYIRRDGERVTFSCPKCRPVTMRVSTLTDRLADADTPTVLMRHLDR